MVHWYFDFISPFAYLQYAWLKRHHPRFQYQAVPVLFAGLLKHWESKGPVEIPAKRTMTYQHCIWLAQKHDIDFKVPPAHPFNPLSCLRFSAAMQNAPDVIDTLFRVIWAEGRDINDTQTWETIAQRTDNQNIEEIINRVDIKNTIRSNTEEAIEKGVFGVPTLSIDGKLFWGFDMTEMAIEYFKSPQSFHLGDYQRVAELPLALSRKQ